MRLFHLVRRDDWARDRDHDHYAPASLAREGFVHFSTGQQLLGTAERFFLGVEDLFVVVVLADRLAAPLRFDETPDGTFPHLHGPLNLDAVTEVAPLLWANGRFHVPEAWRAWREDFDPPDARSK